MKKPGSVESGSADWFRCGATVRGHHRQPALRHHAPTIIAAWAMPEEMNW
ncbi:MAG: hypothetical protein WC205_10125 [Opitutaceae bacterium]